MRELWKQLSTIWKPKLTALSFIPHFCQALVLVGQIPQTYSILFIGRARDGLYYNRFDLAVSQTKKFANVYAKLRPIT